MGEVNFIAVYRVNADKPLEKMIKLKGVYPSVNLSNGCQGQSALWFANQQTHFQPVSPTGNGKSSNVINFKNHEIMVKVRALKLSSFVEELVKEDFPCGLSMENDGIDYELCLH